MWIRFRNYLVLGFFAITPLAVTVGIGVWLIGFLDDLFYSVFPFANRLQIFGRPIPGLGMVGALALLAGVGFLAKTFFWKSIQIMMDRFFQRLPILKSVYTTTQQIVLAFRGGEGRSSFQEVVRVPFFSAQGRAIGFVASRPNPQQVIVFVPTAPNPTSGYVLWYDVKDVEPSPLSVNEALQIVVSCGTLGAVRAPSAPHPS